MNLPANTDNQTLSLTGNNLSVLNGNSVILPTSLDNDSTNELQDLVLNGNALGLTKSSITVNLSNLNSATNRLSQNSFCLTGGQYFDLSTLYNTYSNVGAEAVLSSKVLISCSDPAVGSARFLLNRSNGTILPFAVPPSVGFIRNSDNLLYLFGSSIFVYDVNTGIYIDTIAISNASGQAAVDFITNKIVFKAGSTVYSYNPTTKTQISIPSPTGNLTYLFIGADSVYIGSTLYSAQSLTPLLLNALPFNLYAPNTANSTSFVYNYDKRYFVYKVSTYFPFNQNPPRHQIKKCNRFGGAIQPMSDEYIQTIGGPSVPGTGNGFDLRSTIDGDVVMYWDGGAFVFNNYWFTEATQTWLKMRDDGFVEQITPGNVSVWGGFEFAQHPRHTVVKLLFNKNCVDNQMANKGIYVFNR